MSSTGQRIASNTLFLYLRMVLNIIISIYTVRVVWQVLGIDNYGVFNLVAGLTSMFSFLQGGMVQSSQRFISYELGVGCLDQMRQVFSISLKSHFIIGLIILLLTEPIGIWLINFELNIPPDKIFAANWVFQASLLSFFTSIISVPYGSLIVAHEHMKIYGYFGILDVVLKLVIVYVLIIIPLNKLVAYSTLIVLVALFMRWLNYFYCKRHFEECRYVATKSNSKMKHMLSFAGWSFMGNMGFAARDQGMNILLNMFFSVAMNAAKGIANNVSGVLANFTSTFQMAMNPQITKRYAQGDNENVLKLIYTGSKISFFLFLVLAIPLFVACEQVLVLWLDKIEPITLGFLRLVLIMALIDTLANPVTTTLQASGDIKLFQIVIFIMMVLTVPIAWVGLKLTHNPLFVMYAPILMAVCAQCFRLKLLKGVINYRYSDYIKNVTIRQLACVIILFPIAFVLYNCFSQTLINLIIYCICIGCIELSIIYIIGLNKEERSMVISIITSRFRKKTVS